MWNLDSKQNLTILWAGILFIFVGVVVPISAYIDSTYWFGNQSHFLPYLFCSVWEIFIFGAGYFVARTQYAIFEGF
jgi:hypothetical protein